MGHMALVRLHTQHHQAGGLTPATPTCCCCSCCCVGSTLGTLAVLPVMVGLAGGGRPVLPPVASRQWTAKSLDPAPQAPQVKRGLDRPLGAGLLALAVAVAPFVFGWLIVILFASMGSSVENSTGALFLAIAQLFVGAIVSLTVWAALRARRRGGPMWPPLIITLVLLPVAFITEFSIGLSMVSDGNPAYGWVALGIGAGIFALGVLFSWRAWRS